MQHTPECKGVKRHAMAVHRGSSAGRSSRKGEYRLVAARWNFETGSDNFLMPQEAPLVDENGLARCRVPGKRAQNLSHRRAAGDGLDEQSYNGVSDTDYPIANLKNASEFRVAA